MGFPVGGCASQRAGWPQVRAPYLVSFTSPHPGSSDNSGSYSRRVFTRPVNPWDSLTADGEGTQEVKGCILTLKTNNGAVLYPFFICFILRQRLAEVPGWPYPASASQVLQVGVQKPSGPFEEQEIHHA